MSVTAPHELNSTRSILYRESHDTDIFDCAIGQPQTILKVTVCSVARGAVDNLFSVVSLFGVNPIQHQIQRRRDPWIVSKDPEGLVRPGHSPRRDAPAKAAGVTEALGPGPIRFASLQFFVEVLQFDEAAPEAGIVGLRPELSPGTRRSNSFGSSGAFSIDHFQIAWARLAGIGGSTLRCTRMTVA